MNVYKERGKHVKDTFGKINIIIKIMAEQYVNIHLLLDRINRHPLLQDLPFETAVDFTVDFMRIVGVPNMFMEKTEIIEVKNYRAMLPCDYYQMIQVRKVGGPAFRYSSDSFHMSECKDSNGRDLADLTYKIQGNIIYTSIDCKNLFVIN